MKILRGKALMYLEGLQAALKHAEAGGPDHAVWVHALHLKTTAEAYRVLDIITESELSEFRAVAVMPLGVHPGRRRRNPPQWLLGSVLNNDKRRATDRRGR